MITVAGFNTAIDRLVSIATLQPGQVQRAQSVRIAPGGKGLHVAQTIAALGEPVQLIGVCDAQHREVIQQRMRERGVVFHAVDIEQPLRSCIAIRESDGRTTELLDPGTELSNRARHALLDAWQRYATQSDQMVISGSLPMGFAADTYARMARHVVSLGMPCVVDASGEPLQHLALSRVHLLKPNADEAATLLRREIRTLAQAVTAVRELHGMGIAWPVVTLGAQGAVGFDGARTWHASIALDGPIHAVGSGDCFLAGMVVALRRGEPMAQALKLAVACGAANAMEEETGYATAAAVHALLENVQLRCMDDDG